MNVVIIQTFDKMNYVIQCGFCRGRGRKPKIIRSWQITEYTGETCDVCNGKGALRVQVNDFLIPDGKCQGTGLDRPDDTAPVYKCQTCAGVGARSLSGELKIIR